MSELLPPIVSAEWLAERLATNTAESSRIRVVDVRWYLDGSPGHAAYLSGHIPGAVFVDLDTVLAAPATAADGRHPLPTPEVFADGLGAAGIGPNDIVVAYDDRSGISAGRLVWMLRIIGASAALLDGGLPAWDGALSTGAESLPPVRRQAVAWPADALATADEVEAVVDAGGVVIDARAPERYRGETEPIDPRAGHIPGAINLPFTDNLDDQERFRPAEQLGHRFSEAGAGGEAIMYCGSGVSACHNVLAMEAAGLDRPRLYVGSWSQWSSDSSRPAATAE